MSVAGWTSSTLIALFQRPVPLQVIPGFGLNRQCLSTPDFESTGEIVLA